MNSTICLTTSQTQRHSCSGWRLDKSRIHDPDTETATNSTICLTITLLVIRVVVGGWREMLSCASSTRLGKTYTRHFSTHRWDQFTH